MKSYTLGTKLIRYIVPVLAALFLAGCSSQPSESTGKKVIEKRIQTQSNGLIKLVSFKKTNASSPDKNSYVLEYEMEIEYLDDCWVPSGGLEVTPPDLIAAPISSSPPSSVLFAVKKRKGETTKTSSWLGFKKTEKGWRSDDGDVY
jgi:hypothetical protein